MRIRTVMTGTALATLLLGAAAVPVAAAADDSSCTVTASLPAKLVIKSWSSVVTARLDDPTGCAESATWSIVKGSEDTNSSASFSSPNTVDRVSFYTGPSGAHAGRYRAVGDSAYSDRTWTGADGYEESVAVVQQDSDVMVARYASKVHWRSVLRTGTHVTLRATATRYSPTAAGFGGYTAWKHATVAVQRRVAGAWQTVKTVRSDAKGAIVARVTGRASSWRLVTADSSTVWGAKGTSRRV